MSYRYYRLKKRYSYKSALGLFCVITALLICFKSPVSSSIAKTNSSLPNIDWGMSPDEVEYITKDFSRDTKFFKNGQRSVLIQRERIT